MKETPLSLCERASLLEKIQNKIRLDGRRFLEFRPWEIYFGKNYGCCTVVLGETRVMCTVSCEVVEPRPSRPNEGKLSIHVHLSPMAAAHFEQGRNNEIADEIQQILDRNIKESRCLDIESLCIMAEESVWQFRVDITILSHAGNLGDACNVAAVSALRHFHRPDVTVEEDGRVSVHTHAEKEMIPTYMKKVPVCLTYGFFLIDEEYYIIMDPTYLEERVLSGKLIVGLNPLGEITSLLFPGKVRLKKRQILTCISNAFSNAKSTAETIMKKVDDDLEKRKMTILSPEGFSEMLNIESNYKKQIIMNRINALKKPAAPVKTEIYDESQIMSCDDDEID